jgi:EAL domain-containing protein (putative c-di-GMP-specific phosphodiesterase class I)
LGMVSPAEFIPVAEESGSIMPIGEWVMRTAVAQLKRWIDEGYPSIFVAVNLSAVQFRHPSLLGLVSGILEESKLPPQCLEFELTEGVAMHDPEQVSSVIEKLHELGIRIAIDDFGTGYSSLNYLKRFKIHKLKIDRSFVHDLTTDLEDKAIVAAIISMANNLGLLTMAEGVETAGQLAYLKEQGCHEAQGFYLSKPVPAEEIEKLLNGSSG